MLNHILHLPPNTLSARNAVNLAKIGLVSFQSGVAMCLAAAVHSHMFAGAPATYLPVEFVSARCPAFADLGTQVVHPTILGKSWSCVRVDGGGQGEGALVNRGNA